VEIRTTPTGILFKEVRNLRIRTQAIKPIMKYLFSIVTLFAGLCCCAQSGGTLEFDVKPEASFARVAGQVVDLSSNLEIELPAGQYNVELWAPGFEINKEEVTVTAGQRVFVRKGLTNVNSNYREFEEKLDVYRRTKGGRLFTGIGLLAVNAGAAFLVTTGKYREANNTIQKLEILQTNYANALAPEELAITVAAYEGRLEEFRSAKSAHETRLNIGIPVLLATTAATVYFISRRAKKRPLVRPVFAANNPFVSIFSRPSPFFTMNTAGVAAGAIFKF
jgi:hypothetical protein